MVTQFNSLEDGLFGSPGPQWKQGNSGHVHNVVVVVMSCDPHQAQHTKDLCSQAPAEMREPYRCTSAHLSSSSLLSLL